MDSAPLCSHSLSSKNHAWFTTENLLRALLYTRNWQRPNASRRHRQGTTPRERRTRKKRAEGAWPHRPRPCRGDTTEPTARTMTSRTPHCRAHTTEPTARTMTSGGPALRQTPGQKQKPHSALGGRQTGTSASPSLHPTPPLPAHLPAPQCSTCLFQSHQHWVLDEELFDGHEE